MKPQTWVFVVLEGRAGELELVVGVFKTLEAAQAACNNLKGKTETRIETFCLQ
jgi:hypothetical protein